MEVGIGDSRTAGVGVVQYTCFGAGTERQCRVVADCRCRCCRNNVVARLGKFSVMLVVLAGIAHQYTAALCRTTAGGTTTAVDAGPHDSSCFAGDARRVEGGSSPG